MMDEDEIMWAAPIPWHEELVFWLVVTTMYGAVFFAGIALGLHWAQ